MVLVGSGLVKLISVSSLDRRGKMYTSRIEGLRLGVKEERVGRREKSKRRIIFIVWNQKKKLTLKKHMLLL